jgi:ribosome-binding factor A
MDSNRQQKINRLIQKELSELFLLETKKTHGDCFGSGVR